MDVQQAELYQRIQAFSLDDSDAHLSFSKRLARDNAWSAEYTQRVIDEYKKFTFLGVVAGHPVTPSDQVDQVWHLHLIYTHSYWGEFCPNVLQTPFHHGPTRGGRREHHKFNDWYSKTLASYERFFGYSPPADIWPPPHLRFGRDLHFLRVNTQQNWILPKPTLELPNLHWERSPIIVLLFLLALTVTGCSSLSLISISNPLNFKGPEFLLFYSLAASTAIVLAYILRWYLQKFTLHSSDESDTSEQLSSLNTYDIAYLVDGHIRAVDVAIINLIQRGHLQVHRNTYTLDLGSVLPTDCHPLERAIVQAVEQNKRPSQIRKAVTSTTLSIEARLRQLGLLTGSRQANSIQASNRKTLRRARVVQWLSVLPIFAVLLLGIAKIIVGISRDKPVGFLLILCLITAVVGFYLYLSAEPQHLLTQSHRSGNTSTSYERTLKNLQAKYEPLKNLSASETDQLGLAFAVFGSVVLADNSFADFKHVLGLPESISKPVAGYHSYSSSTKYDGYSSSTKSSSYSSSRKSGVYGGGIDSSCDAGGDGSCGDGGDGGCGGGGCGGCGG